MARSRNIKPGFFRNEILAELPQGTRLLFAGLWTIADKAGRLEDRPKRIKADVLPYDDDDVDAMLEALAKKSFIARYKHGAARYIQILNFDKHQNPHKNEGESEIPPPAEINSQAQDGGNDADVSGDSEAKKPMESTVREKSGTSTVQVSDKHSSNRADSLNLIPDSLNTDSGFPTDAQAKPAPSPEAPFALLESLCETQGQDVSVLSKRDKDKQLGVAKRLIADGMTANDVARMTKWLMAQAWITGGIDFFLIEKQVGKWRMSGQPESVSPQTPNGSLTRMYGGNQSGTPQESVWDRVARERGYVPDDPTPDIDAIETEGKMSS